MRWIALLFAVALASCAGPTVPPAVDMTGVTPAQYSHDLAECEEYRRHLVIGLGPPLANCMRGKGYHVIIGPS